jgi:uncharacterized coiled-coil protein SlyX
MGPEFFQTAMGRKFYESDVPRIAAALEQIATALSSRAAPEVEARAARVDRIASDMSEQITEANAELARNKQTLRAIVALCNAPHWDAKRRWKIAALAMGSEKP